MGRQERDVEVEEAMVCVWGSKGSGVGWGVFSVWYPDGVVCVKKVVAPTQD